MEAVEIYPGMSLFPSHGRNFRFGKVRVACDTPSGRSEDQSFGREKTTMDILEKLWLKLTVTLLRARDDDTHPVQQCGDRAPVPYLNLVSCEQHLMIVVLYFIERPCLQERFVFTPVFCVR